MTCLTYVGDIRTDRFKQRNDIHLPIMAQINNMSINNNCCPDDLKFAEVSPIFKRKDDLYKENDRLVSVLFRLSNVSERIMYKQIEDFMKDKFSTLLTDFRKNRSTLHCLIRMLERWKKTLDKGGYICAIFIDLSKPLTH